MTVDTRQVDGFSVLDSDFLPTHFPTDPTVPVSDLPAVVALLGLCFTGDPRDADAGQSHCRCCSACFQ
ncbi:MAG: hypothetical protein U5K70_01210 [Halodesulfurarchaeum sp.]|nr:hypothetical protein [Halodesulfurarchaeum sp.]